MRGALALVAALVALPATAAPASAQTRVDAPGRWSLQRLGYGSAAVPLTGRSGPDALPAGRVSFRYRLPAGAREGADAWYLVRLHALVDFAPGTRRSLAYLTGATNGRTASLTRLVVAPGNGPVHWSSFDQLDGLVTRTTPGRRVEVINENFLQFGGVRPGVNTLSFAVDQLRSARVRAVRILPDSGIEITGAGPAELTADASVSRAGVRVGEPFHVRVVVANPSRRPASQIRAHLDVDGTVVSPVGATSRRLRDLPPDGRASATFALRARRKGDSRLAVTVDSASASPTAAVPVRIAPRQSTLDRVAPFAVLVAVAGTALALAGAALVRRRRE